MDMQDVMSLVAGRLNSDDYYSSEVIEFESAWAASMPGCSRISPRTSCKAPLIAPGSDGINGIRLANAIHLSSWTGAEVPLDFDEDAYLAELN